MFKIHLEPAAIAKALQESPTMEMAAKALGVDPRTVTRRCLRPPLAKLYLECVERGKQFNVDQWRAKRHGRH